jgi:ubiquinone/menaquinone biosynthesis C-methylase UbiE
MEHETLLAQYKDVLKQRYEDIGLTGDDRGTADDFHLREMEIQTGLRYMQDGHKVLDVGSGTGYSLRQYARALAIDGVGVDYAESMVMTAAAKYAETRKELKGTLRFTHASVLDLPFEDNTFDVVTSGRCLMALLDWGLQKKAMVEINRVMKPGGVFVMMEGTFQGLERLNDMRERFGLTPIDARGLNRLVTLKFDEDALVEFGQGVMDLMTIHRYGMYYFISRVIHPLLVAPEQPRYDARINEVARLIAEKIPDYQGLGHMAAFIWRKRAPKTV